MRWSQHAKCSLLSAQNTSSLLNDIIMIIIIKLFILIMMTTVNRLMRKGTHSFMHESLKQHDYPTKKIAIEFFRWACSSTIVYVFKRMWRGKKVFDIKNLSIRGKTCRRVKRKINEILNCVLWKWKKKEFDERKFFSSVSPNYSVNLVSNEFSFSNMS